MRNILLFYPCLFVLLVWSNTIYSFSTLKSLQKYAHAYPEYPPIDNNDLFNPNYTSFHKSITYHSWLDWIRYIGLTKKPNWHGKQFKKLLEEVAEKRSVQKLKSNMVAHLHCKVNATFYIWSDINGSFHSLCRSLTFLHAQQIIDNELKIVQQNTYFIFNGNCIHGSAYNLETLHVLLLLLKQNPDSVFYICGEQEAPGYWKNTGLKRELLIRAEHLDNNRIPLESHINQFFNTLPLALYISIEKKPSELIRISPLHFSNQNIQEQFMGNLFSTYIDTALTYYDIDQQKPLSSAIDIKAIITTEDWIKSQRISTGLELLNQYMGATVWALLSTPTSAHRAYYKFFYDAYAVINMGSTIDSSTITLFRNNTQENEGFQTHKKYNVVTAIPSDSPAYKQPRKSDLFIGSSMSLEQGVPIMGQRTAQGMAIKINEVNQTGGINGHHLRLVIKNDNYVPYLARQNIINFMKNNITTILLPIGSPTLQAYIDFIKDNKILVLFPVTGGPQFRTSELKGLVHWRADYIDEVKVLINHLITEYNTRKFAFFYQDDAYGQEPLKAAHAVLERHQLSGWEDISYARATLNLDEQAQKIKNAQSDAIGFFSSANPTASLIQQVGIATLSSKQLFGISFLGEESFRLFIKNLGIKVLFGAVVPNPAISELEIVQEYRRAMDNNNTPYDVFSLEAYIATTVLVDIMKKLDDPITNEKILHKLESLDHYQLKGLTLTFNAQSRDLSQPVWLETEKNKPWSQGAVIHNNP